MLKGISLVTGASRGIGRSIAHRLAKDGFCVMLNDLPGQSESLIAVERNIMERGGKAGICFADVSVEQDVQAMVTETVKRFGTLDVMIANAGFWVTKPFLESSAADYNRTLLVNAFGTFFCYKYAAKQMIEQGRGGRIIGASSLAGKQGSPFLSLYSSSKFAVRGLTQAAAKELAQHGITVNAYAPGPVNTMTPDEVQKMVPKSRPNNAHENSVAASMQSPIGRYATPDEVAGLVSFLASEEASMITGQTISINGGLYCD